MGERRARPRHPKRPLHGGGSAGGHVRGAAFVLSALNPLERLQRGRSRSPTRSARRARYTLARSPTRRSSDRGSIPPRRGPDSPEPSGPRRIDPPGGSKSSRRDREILQELLNAPAKTASARRGAQRVARHRVQGARTRENNTARLAAAPIGAMANSGIGREKANRARARRRRMASRAMAAGRRCRQGKPDASDPARAP